MSSLQEQLLQAGLVDKKKAKKVKKDKAKQAKVDRRSSSPIENETQNRAKQAMSEKVEKDRKLNAERNAEAQRKAIIAQIKQLIVTNAIRRDGDIAFNFKDGNLIKKFYISEKLQNALARGQIAVVKLNESYELVPAIIAEKISQRDASYVLSHADKTDIENDDDPYADYQIPDDLMW